MPNEKHPSAAFEHRLPRDGDASFQGWLRAQTRVRCALSAHGVSCLKDYLQRGDDVARRVETAAFRVHLRMLRTLLLTAQDEALPGPWRRLCLAHAHLPLARLAPTIGIHDPIAMQALEASVQRTRDRFRPARAARPGRSSG